MKLKLIWNDIIEEPADAVVTPASRRPQIGTGLDKAIHAAAGPELLTARKGLGEIGPGIVKYTKSFGLKKCKCKAKYVIHALGPFCEKDGHLNGTEKPILLGCYLQIFCVAAELGAKIVSTPVMSSGKFGMAMDVALDTAVEAAKLFLAARPDMMIKIVGIDSDFYEYAGGKYPAFFVGKFDKSREAKYRQLYTRQRKAGENENHEAFEEDETQSYFRRVKFERDVRGKTFKQLFQLLWHRRQDADKRRKAESVKKHHFTSRANRRHFLCSVNELSIASEVTANYIKKFLTNTSENRHPSRDVVLSLCVALALDIDYASALLAKCDYHFEKSSRDAVIMDYISTGKGDVFDLNKILNDKDLDPLASNSDIG